MNAATQPNAFSVSRTRAAYLFAALALVYAVEAQALTINQFRSSIESNSGEILDPSENQPHQLPLRSKDEPDASAIMSDRFSDPLTDNATITDHFDGQGKDVPSELALNLTGMGGKSDLSDTLTSLEWIEQWSVSGEWLENDQWADFKAIAIAGYLPDIRYWLGGDRWASLGLAPLATDADGNPLLQSDVPAAVESAPADSTAYSRVSSAYENERNGSGTNDKTSNSSEPAINVTFTEFLVSILGKVVREPIFYVIALCGTGLLLWSFRKQSAS